MGYREEWNLQSIVAGLAKSLGLHHRENSTLLGKCRQSGEFDWFGLLAFSNKRYREILVPSK
jgi:hypothetical protein